MKRNMANCPCPAPQATLVAEVPQEFIEDMAALYPDGPRIPAGAKVFDVFRMWRLDSGSYEDIAEVGSYNPAWAPCLHCRNR